MEVIIVFPFLLVIIFILGYFFIVNSKVANKRKILFEKVIITIVSALLISLIWTYFNYTPVEIRESDVLYESYLGLFMIYLFIFLPVFLVYGTLLSFIIDLKVEKIRLDSLLLSYLIKVIAYALGGVVIVGLLLMLTSITSAKSISSGELYTIYILGILPSLLLYHVSLFVQLLKLTMNISYKKIK